MKRADAIKKLEKVLKDQYSDICKSLGRVGSEIEQIDNSGDPADVARDLVAGTINSSLADSVTEELKSIGFALGRFKDGTFGACGECGKNIPMARLEALPSAERCIPCQEVYENG